jgi:hypothetical protein
MTADDFRRLALECPEAVEGYHMGHADFRVGGKIFASLPDLDEDLGDLGMVKLTPEQQTQVLEEEPEVFRPCQGAWGVGGATYVRLKKARVGIVRRVLEQASRNTAPKRVAATAEKPAVRRTRGKRS